MFKVEIEGHVGGDPEMRYLEDGTAVTSFPVAAHWLEKGVQMTEWFKCSAWRSLAGLANQDLKKGDLIRVWGSCRTRLWQRQDGSIEKSLEVNAAGFEKVGHTDDQPVKAKALSTPPESV